MKSLCREMFSVFFMWCDLDLEGLLDFLDDRLSVF